MIKKIFFFLLTIMFLSSCGYKPIYSSKNLNFSIGNIEKSNTALNNEFAKKIYSLGDKESPNKINFKIESSKAVTIKSKDVKGDALVFEMQIILKVLNLNGDKNKNQTFTKKITFKNSDDKFKLKQYEKELEKILITNLVKDLINFFSEIQ